jgi:cobalt-precorrin-5B (C1)-methyltransferase
LRNERSIERVEIPFPDGSRASFRIHDAGFGMQEKTAYASVIKDAGDDPDVTHGAEIVAEAALISDVGCRMSESNTAIITIRGGKGVGVVTKPGLAISVGEAAINPVPRRMIHDAVSEAISEFGLTNPQSEIRNPKLEITISVPAGEELAKKTLNHRLGIIGGISILGTTGIVKPLSEAAWTATITSSFDVAKAQGREEVVLSTGRTSEKAHQKKYGLPEDCYTMMGDYVEYALADAAKHGFSQVHLCAQWAKLVKTAMGTPQTHVRHGALEAEKARDFLIDLGIGLPHDRAFNATREIYDFINNPLALRERAGVRVGPAPAERDQSLSIVCKAAKRFAEGITSGIPVAVHLVSYEGVIVAESE